MTSCNLCFPIITAVREKYKSYFRNSDLLDISCYRMGETAEKPAQG